MSRILIVLAVFLTLAVPTALAVPPAGQGKPESPGNSAAAPGQSADKNAAKKCKAQRKNDAAGFKAQWGDKPNAYGKCVSATAKQLQAAEDKAEQQEAKENAAKKCKELRGTTTDTIAAFKELYGTNKNKANAFGKCVSKLAKAKTTS